MSTQHPHQEPSGGFSRPQFTQPEGPPASPAQRPDVDQHIAQQQGSRADVVAENDRRDSERRSLNRKKRIGFLIAAISVMVVVVVIVALMIWLWSTDLFVTP